MCPVCLATAALIAGKVTSAGGLAAIAMKKFGGKNAVDSSAETDRGPDLGSDLGSDRGCCDKGTEK
jgi:hypothetical protein